MLRNLHPLWMTAAVFGLLIACMGVGLAQDTAGDFIHKPAEVKNMAAFMDRLGYNNYKVVKLEKLQGLAFVVLDKASKELIKLTMLINPNDRILKFECHDLAKVPARPEKLNVLIQKLAELNGTRTFGKYYINPENQRVQYLYFKSVLGGICFADFERTFRLIEFIIFKDITIIRDLTT